MKETNAAPVRPLKSAGKQDAVAAGAAVRVRGAAMGEAAPVESGWLGGLNGGSSAAVSRRAWGAPGFSESVVVLPVTDSGPPDGWCGLEAAGAGTA
ncbi:hypothetical protein ACIRRH_10455 [Kitasatospora sp. NPDC101235]|uniref:hypothetical protein n=1 Tax=Kitasatospora sp. NPDC101235 TaxID=3364101 RepID=UPI0037F7BD94